MKAFRFTGWLKAAEFRTCRFLNRNRERRWLIMPNNLYRVVLILLIWIRYPVICLPILTEGLYEKL
ncbi:MAG: hypothetical protein KAV87_26635 [Desulfobacteraceae bacterium]|nr:hypothetical protein [Desulfobacteraceae bacterium]